MDKVVASADEAVKDMLDGATLVVGGFGLCGIPENLIAALVRQGVKDLTVVSNNCGVDDWGLGLLLRTGRSGRWSRRTSERTRSSSGSTSPASSRSSSCPRARSPSACAPAARASPASYTPAGAGTLVAEGKETRVFAGRELPARARASSATSPSSRPGRPIGSATSSTAKSARNFNPMAEPPGRVTVAEVEELVELGALDPDHVHTPASTSTGSSLRRGRSASSGAR